MIMGACVVKPLCPKKIRTVTIDAQNVTETFDQRRNMDNRKQKPLVCYTTTIREQNTNQLRVTPLTEQRFASKLRQRSPRRQKMTAIFES